jgi:hypothetical protein
MGTGKTPLNFQKARGLGFVCDQMGAPAVKEAVFHVAFTKYSSRSLLRELADVK